MKEAFGENTAQKISKQRSLAHRRFELLAFICTREMRASVTQVTVHQIESICKTNLEILAAK